MNDELAGEGAADDAASDDKKNPIGFEPPEPFPEKDRDDVHRLLGFQADDIFVAEKDKERLMRTAPDAEPLAFQPDRGFEAGFQANDAPAPPRVYSVAEQRIAPRMDSLGSSPPRADIDFEQGRSAASGPERRSAPVAVPEPQIPHNLHAVAVVGLPALSPRVPARRATAQPMRPGAAASGTDLRADSAHGATLNGPTALEL
ncbi:MAG: hypothetical protein HOV68_18875 [Streptomycetaceae bacterium]|nr:hypothetical protein [Streptomycetaceae bacterium]